MNDTVKRIGVRIAADSLQLLLAEGGFNIYKLVTIVDNAVQEGRRPTDEELMAASEELEQNIKRVFSMPAASITEAGNSGVEPNDRGHNDH